MKYRRRRQANSRLRRVVRAEPALADLGRIQSYIGQFNPLAAQRMAARLIAATETLSSHAELGRALGRGRRELVIVRPYLIRYRIEDPTVVILRIRHGAQRPA